MNRQLDAALEYNFSGQQRCMNVLMTKLGEENNLDANQTKDYRKNSQNKTFLRYNATFKIKKFTP